MSKETLTMYNGNKQKYKKPLPRIQILDIMNDTAKAWIEKNTKLKLEDCHWGYIAQPTSSQQITKLFLTYNFKTRYFNNGSIENTILLKFARDEDWDSKR